MRKFELIVTEDDDGNVDFETSNTGFNAGEILGMLEIKQQDILDQLHRPDTFIRRFIHPDGTVEVKEKKDESSNQ